MYAYGTLLDGAWLAGAGARFTTHDPAAPECIVGEYQQTTTHELENALEAALRGQAEWAQQPPAERARLIGLFLDEVAKQTEPIAEAITREQGKPLAEARGELGKALREARFMTGEAVRAGGTLMAAQKPECQNLIMRRPRGLIGAITPWNFPVLTPMRKLAPALSHGNAIVLKPSELTPAAACLLAEAARAVLPPGLVQIVQGGAGVGHALASSPRIDGMTFTGSVSAGKSIYAAAAANLTEVSLELGGKNAVVINDTHDLEYCLDQVVGAAFPCAGQRCTAISRVVVAEPLAPAVIEGLASRAGAMVLGNGSEPGTNLGPLINADQLERVAGFVGRALNDGARAVTGGARAAVDAWPGGYFYQPTVLTDVTREMEAAREEIFGPVLTVTSYSDFNEALQILNGVDYGLTSSLFSNDAALIQRFLAESQNGMLHINHGTQPDDHMPFGGIKQSGVGAYSVGSSTAQFYTTEHSAYLQTPSRAP